MPDDEPIQPEEGNTEGSDTMPVRRRKRRTAAQKPVASGEMAAGETTQAEQPESPDAAAVPEKPTLDEAEGAVQRTPRRRRAPTRDASTDGAAAATPETAEAANAKSRKLPTPPHIGEVGRNVPFADGQEVIYGNQYTQVGFLMDMWADLIPGYADRAGDLWVNYRGLLTLKLADKAQTKLDNLQATGVFPAVRTMHFVRRKPVTVTVYIATQAEDLYLSWRAFVQTDLSVIRLGIIVVLGVLAGVLINLPGLLLSFRPDFVAFARQTAIVTAVVSGTLLVIAAAYGWYYVKGDYLALLRQPVHELYIDDVVALSTAVHQSLMAAADKVGIDTAKLTAHEPFYAPRNRTRLRL